MEHFARMQIFHRTSHSPSPGQSCGQEPVSQPDLGVGTTAGGVPGSELGSSSETGADRAFRIVKSETMKQVDHKR